MLLYLKVQVRFLPVPSSLNRTLLVSKVIFLLKVINFYLIMRTAISNSSIIPFVWFFDNFDVITNTIGRLLFSFSLFLLSTSATSDLTASKVIILAVLTTSDWVLVFLGGERFFINTNNFKPLRFYDLNWESTKIWILLPRQKVWFSDDSVILVSIKQSNKTESIGRQLTQSNLKHNIWLHIFIWNNEALILTV